MAAGVIGGMIAGQCTTDSFSSGSRNGNGGSSRGQSGSNNYGAQCTW